MRRSTAGECPGYSAAAGTDTPPDRSVDAQVCRQPWNRAAEAVLKVLHAIAEDRTAVSPWPAVACRCVHLAGPRYLPQCVLRGSGAVPHGEGHHHRLTGHLSRSGTGHHTGNVAPALVPPSWPPSPAMTGPGDTVESLDDLTGRHAWHADALRKEHPEVSFFPVPAH